MPKLKYEAEIAEFDPSCKDCPPADAAPTTVKAYRWVANPMTTECFFPPGKKNPGRVSIAKGAANCGLFGVSMYISKQQSMDAFKKVEASFQFARKTLGGYVAEGDLQAAHGLCTKPNTYGHFDVHEFEAVSLKPSFLLLCEIPK